MSIFSKAKDKLDRVHAEHAEQAAQRQAYSDVLAKLPAPGADIPAILAALPSSSAFNPKDLTMVQTNAFQTLAYAMLADDILDETEERNLLAAGQALGVTTDRLNHEFAPLLERLVIAQVNNGRLPSVDASDVRVPLKSGETAHIVSSAALIKWHDVKEWRGANHGFSFRVAKGVYYRTGQTRGHIVTTGQQLATEDTGVLTITNRRVVFNGSRKALEFDYKKLVDVEVYTDGLKLAVSNRQAPSVLRTSRSGDLLAAIINAAASRV
jgi:hypothetical protein